MNGTRFKPVIRECLGRISREARIALTPIPRNKKWLFIVGCYNSGTTLLSELLGHHPAISALTTEGHFITDQFVKDYEIGLPRMWVEREDLFCLNENSTGPDHIRLMKEWAMRLDCSKQVLVEKSPPNTAKTRWLQKHFPDAHFVAIVRDPYAVSEGITRKANPIHLINSWPIEMSFNQWKRSNEILNEDSKHLKKFMWIKYEDLTENPTEILNKITNFCGIDNFDGVEEGRQWSIHERNEEIRNMNNESIKRLSKEQIDSINRIMGDVDFDFGYEKL